MQSRPLPAPNTSSQAIAGVNPQQSSHDEEKQFFAQYTITRALNFVKNGCPEMNDQEAMGLICREFLISKGVSFDLYDQSRRSLMERFIEWI